MKSEKSFKSFRLIIPIEMVTIKNEIENHIFKGKMRSYQDTLIKFYLDSGRAKSADPKLQTILGYLSIHKYLTQNQIRDLTGYSKGTISKKLNFLVKSGVIKKTALKNSNEKLYQIDELIYAKVGDFSYTEFPKIKTELESILLKLSKIKEKSGKELLSDRIIELISVLDLITKIWTDIKGVFEKPSDKMQ